MQFLTGMKKEERLHHRSLVEGLFLKGKTFYEYPLRVTWRKINVEALNKNFRNAVPEDIAKVQFMVSVPKKKRKRAVDRVLLRRRIREAYRLNCEELKSVAEQNSDFRTMSVAMVYIHDENMQYVVIEEKVKGAIKKLCNLASKKEES